MMIFINVLNLLFAGFMQVKTEVICDANVGPAGTQGCVLLTPYYNKYQPSTCVRDAYMKQKSKDRHFCRDRTIYCWYQCMLELHDLAEGPVFDDCTCVPNATIATVTLDPSCYSPSGDSCTWYKNCLEKRHPCEGTNHSYAIDFATKFCNLYNESYNSFTSTGQSWIDAVRKCLQVTLVPMIRPYSNATCQDIQTKALESHPSCYLNPFPEKPSICDISCLDWWHTFWTVHESACSFPSENVDGMVKVFRGCASSASCFAAQYGNKLLNVITAPRLTNGLITICNVAHKIADFLHWDHSDVAWYSFADCKSSVSKDLSINILLTWKGTYDLRFNASRSIIDLNKITEDFGNAVRDGRLSFNDIDGISQPVYINRMSVCEDLNCTRTTRQFTTPAFPPATAIPSTPEPDSSTISTPVQSNSSIDALSTPWNQSTAVSSNPTTSVSSALSSKVRSNANPVISVIGCVFVAIVHLQAFNV